MSSNLKKKQDKKPNGQLNGSKAIKSTTTKIGKVPVDLKNPEPIDPEKVEAFRRIVSAEDFEELDDHSNSNGAD